MITINVDKLSSGLYQVHDGRIHKYKAYVYGGKVRTYEIGEIVRCGECGYWECNPKTEKYGVCKKVSYDDFEVIMDSDDFCSYGKRRVSNE